VAIKLLGCEVQHSSLLADEVKDVWLCAFTPPDFTVACFLNDEYGQVQ
jgi:hypothetical protein